MKTIIDQIEKLQIILDDLLDAVKKFQASLIDQEDKIYHDRKESDEQTYPENPPEDPDDHEKDADILRDSL